MDLVEVEVAAQLVHYQEDGEVDRPLRTWLINPLHQSRSLQQQLLQPPQVFRLA